MNWNSFWRWKILRKVIKGCVYDTETAELIGDYIFGIPNDFNYRYEALYITNSSRYFIFGEGGPQSPWRKALVGNAYSFGRGIIPLTETDALDWAKNHLEHNIIRKYFGNNVEACWYP